MAKSAIATDSPLLMELVSIKRLLVFSLLRSGISQEQVAIALGVNQSQVSRMFPGGVVVKHGNKSRVKHE